MQKNVMQLYHGFFLITGYKRLPAATNRAYNGITETAIPPPITPESLMPAFILDLAQAYPAAALAFPAIASALFATVTARIL